MKSLAPLSLLAVSLAYNLSAQQPIEVFVAHHEGDEVGMRFTSAVRDRIARSDLKTHGQVKWELHILTTDDDQHLSTTYHAGLVEVGQSSRKRAIISARKSVNAHVGSATPLESWDGSVELAHVDQQADSLVARLAETLARAEKE